MITRNAAYTRWPVIVYSALKSSEGIEARCAFIRAIQIEMTETAIYVTTGNYDTLLVSFAGHDHMFGMIPRFIFVNFFEKLFPDVDRHFYIDTRTCSYHRGIPGISNTIDETVVFLQGKIAPYKRVIFLGISSGGYAAILFGSLLGVSTVLAFIPQTIRRTNYHVEERYRDLLPYIRTDTNYYLYADTSFTKPEDPHHAEHCDRLAHFPNVTVIRRKNVDVRKMRDSGELAEILRVLVGPSASTL